MADFDETEISVRYYTDLYGIYQFECAPSLPTGAIIGSVTVRAFVGSVSVKSTIDEFTEISADLIDPGYAPNITDDTIIQVKFQYPGNTYKNEKVTLLFELTLSTPTNAKHVLYFKYVRVQGAAT